MSRGASHLFMSRALLRLAALASLAAASLVAKPLVATPLEAQQVVGHLPSQSPFRDIRASQHLTIEGGYLRTQQDEIGATPRSGALLGVRYDVPVSGPAEFYVRVQRVSSHRTAFDPSRPAATRSLGDVSDPLYIADLGFGVDLTGERTWHGVIPLIDVGLGVATAAHAPKADPYSFGTEFAIRGDLGLRIVPGNSVEIRLMAGPVMYQNKYPGAYYTKPATGGSGLLPTSTARSGFRTNWSYTAGLSFPLFR